SPPMHSLPSAALACAIALSKSSETSAGIPRVYELTGADNGTARNVPRLMSADILNACWLDGERKWKSAPPGGPVLFTSGYPDGPMPKPNARSSTWTSSASARHLCASTRAWSARDESEAVVSAYDVPLNAITKTAEHMPYRTAPAAHAPHRFGSHRSGLLPLYSMYDPVPRS